MGAESAQKPVILLGTFTSGAGVDARWSDVASEMQKSFSRALIKTGNFDVVANRSGAEDAQTAFLVEAKITDFLHTSDAPDSVRRLSWFSEANDAIVALDITATEIRTGRVVLSDQVAATVSAGASHKQVGESLSSDNISRSEGAVGGALLCKSCCSKKVGAP